MQSFSKLKSLGESTSIAIATELLDSILKTDDREGRERYKDTHVINLALVLDQHLNYSEYKNNLRLSQSFREHIVAELAYQSSDDFNDDLFNSIEKLTLIIDDVLKLSSLQKLALNAKNEETPATNSQNKWCQLFVRVLDFSKTNPDQGLLTTDVNLDNTVEKLKETIMDEHGIHVERQRLIFESKPLADHETLERSHIKNQDTVRLVMKHW
jgi:hypothetical protein